MPRQSPIPDEIDQPFWEACNRDQLILQYCTACEEFQYPPEAVCGECDSAAQLEWRQIDGRGSIYTYAVVYDTPISVLEAEMPYNVAVIELDDAPGINMMSHLPGTPPDEVPIGAPVRLIFEVTPATGQKVPEWQIVH